jgi:Flp pilus assembly protein TadG
MIDFSTPLQGMQSAADRVNAAGRLIAQTAGPDAGDGVDLSAAAVALLEGCNAFAANAKVAKTVDEMNRSLIDVMG